MLFLPILLNEQYREKLVASKNHSALKVEVAPKRYKKSDFRSKALNPVKYLYLSDNYHTDVR
jgi:hypothetical protein